MQSLLGDIRFGARVLRKNPAFTIAAVLTLALGIGANTAIFTVTNALLLRPFPYREPERLVLVGAKDQNKEFGGTLLRYEMLRDRGQSFEGVAAFATDNFNLTGRGEPIQVPIARASANFFSLLGVPPQLGRTFTEEEGRPEGKPVVIISDVLMDASRAQPRFTMMLLSFFSAAALVLAVIGIYGVLAYFVAERRVELGIRLALGAERSDIVRLVLRQGLELVVAGIVIGLVAALAMSKLMSSLLYNVGVRDLRTFILVPVVFLGIALLASYLPARRATKVDPVEALRGN